MATSTIECDSSRDNTNKIDLEYKLFSLQPQNDLDLMQVLSEEGDEASYDDIFTLITVNQKECPQAFDYEKIKQDVYQKLDHYINNKLELVNAILTTIQASSTISAMEKYQPILPFGKTNGDIIELLDQISILKDKTTEHAKYFPKLSRLLVQIEKKLELVKLEFEDIPSNKIEKYELVVLRNRLQSEDLPVLKKIDAGYFDIDFIQSVFKRIGIFAEVQSELRPGTNFYKFLYHSEDDRDARIISKGVAELDFSIDGYYGDALYVSIKYFQYKKYNADPKIADGILGKGTADALVEEYKKMEEAGKI